MARETEARRHPDLGQPDPVDQVAVNLGAVALKAARGRGSRTLVPIVDAHPILPAPALRCYEAMIQRATGIAILRLVVAGVLGYALIVALTTLGFVGWLDNANLYRGDWLLKLKGMCVALVSGLAGGSLAALVGGLRPVQHALAVIPLLFYDTTYVLFFWPRSDPIWFDLGGGLGLIAATLAGGMLVATLRSRGAARG